MDDEMMRGNGEMGAEACGQGQDGRGDVDLILRNGRVVRLDLGAMTLREYRELFNGRQKPEDEDVVLAKVAGMSVEEFRELSYVDWRRLTLRVFAKAREPLAEKN